MTRGEALAFLRAHQPLPADDDLSDELIQQHDAVRRFFLDHRDPECIPLFLGSFGDGSGCGVYQLVEDVILPFGADQVVVHLSSALGSPWPGVRNWCAEIAGALPDARLAPALWALTDDPSIDTRTWAIYALGRIGGPEVRDRLRGLASTDPAVVAAIEQALAE